MYNKSTKKISPEDYRTKFNNISNGKFTLINDYVNTRTNVSIQCSTCNDIFSANPRDFIRNNMHCKLCDNIYMNTEMFKDKLRSIYSNDVELISEYTNARTTVSIKHKCGYVRDILPGTITRYECPVCSTKSLAEIEITNYLMNNKIEFKKEFCFDDLRTDNKGIPRFDYAIFCNGILKFLLEYDGLFHFKETNFAKHSVSRFQELDKLKSKYCLDNNIRLLRINYTQKKNIIEILKEELELCHSQYQNTRTA